jgi:hypothetical protein
LSGMYAVDERAWRGGLSAFGYLRLIAEHPRCNRDPLGWLTSAEAAAAAAVAAARSCCSRVRASRS